MENFGGNSLGALWLREHPNIFCSVVAMSNPRQLAFVALREIYRRDSYTDIALDRTLRNCREISGRDRGLATQLVYGVVRQQRTLDAIINQLAKKQAHQQPPDLRLIFHLGLYQLRYLNQIPEAAAVDTTVELAKANGYSRLAGVVNGVLRQYLRLGSTALTLPESPVERLGTQYSFPDWIVELWLQEWGETKTEELCAWFNQTPAIDLRVNPLHTSIEEVESALVEAGVAVSHIKNLPQALRLQGSVGAIQKLPGFELGWWSVQDSSAQLVSYLLDPQPGEVIIDACAAPGGKTTHIAELMADNGTIWACDRAAKRLKKVSENAQRLQLNSIKTCSGDSRDFTQFSHIADRVLVDAPCSGLGTLHRHPDIRWRKTPDKIPELSQLQREILQQAATWVKPAGSLVYATCTLNFQENEAIINNFLQQHPHWQIQPPSIDSPLQIFTDNQGWLKVLPSDHNMDGFFMVKLKQV